MRCQSTTAVTNNNNNSADIISNARNDLEELPPHDIATVIKSEVCLLCIVH